MMDVNKNVLLSKLCEFKRELSLRFVRCDGKMHTVCNYCHSRWHSGQKEAYYNYSTQITHMKHCLIYKINKLWVDVKKGGE